jgi:macrolide transport system ATP-binding/permease protein
LNLTFGFMATLRNILGPPLTEHLNLSDVSHGYGDRQLLDGISLVINAGEHIAVVGENGAGKSTLLRIMAGVEAPDEGSAVIHGRVGYLAQAHGLPESFTVGAAIDASLASLRAIEAQLDRLEEGLADAEAGELEAYGRLQTEYQLREGYAAESRVEAALDRLGLGGLDRNRMLGSLSGGEQSRVSLARVLAQETPILLLDEPTANLDLRHQEMVMVLARQIADRGGVVVVIAHDLNLAAAHADRVAMLAGGRLAAVGTPWETFNEALLTSVFDCAVSVTRHPLRNCPLILTPPDAESV